MIYFKFTQLETKNSRWPKIITSQRFHFRFLRIKGIYVPFDQTKFTTLYKNFQQKFYLEAQNKMSLVFDIKNKMLDLSYKYIITISDFLFSSHNFCLAI